MSKWFGKIGYALQEEIEPGIFSDNSIEKEYYGDLTNPRWRRQSGSKVNDDINLTNVLSIVADPFAYEHVSDMAYVVIDGAKWKIETADVSNRPRIELTVGGVWNENSSGSSE